MNLRLTLHALALGLFLTLSAGLSAQADSTLTNNDDDSRPLLLRNVIHGSVGVGPVLSATIFYEHIFLQPAGRGPAVYARGGYGSMAVLLADNSRYVLVQGGIITGRKNSHFEAALGAIYLFDNQLEGFAPALSAGYRLQKPGSHFMFRTGLGFPEDVYVGIGVCF